MLDRLVSEIGLDRSGIDAVVRQLKPAGMTKHVRADLHFEAGSLGSAVYHRLEATLGHTADRLTVKTLFCRCTDFAGVCVAAATVALSHKKHGCHSVGF